MPDHRLQSAARLDTRPPIVALAIALASAAGCASAHEVADARPPVDARVAVDAAFADAPIGSPDASPSIDAPVTTVDAMASADASMPLNIGLRIVEVYYDHTSDDNNYEWVKLYNGTPSAINLGNYSLGWGGTDYTYGIKDLAGTIGAYDCFLIGGPSGNATSGFAGAVSFDLATDFNPDIQNSNGAGLADGVALFNVPASGIMATTTPVHAVIYGTTNSSGLYDENGPSGDIDVANAPPESSIKMKPDTSWEINPAPSPQSCF